MKQAYITLDETLLRELYVEYGLNLRVLGRLFHCSPDTIRRRLIDYGIPRRSHRLALPQDELERLHDQRGWTVYELAARYGCSHMTIANRLHGR